MTSLKSAKYLNKGKLTIVNSVLGGDNMKEHKLEKLPYDYNALEPYIDAQTMEVHHDKHHQAYCNNLNAALQKYPELFKKKPEELIANLESIPEDIRTAVRNNGGGFVNHNFFWKILKKGVEPKGKILEAISQKFGGFDSFKEQFSKAAAGQFGSGWAWLVVSNSELEIIGTPNQDSPLAQGKHPILAIDVWEHAYYLKYQNKRPEYIQNFFSAINWEEVEKLYKKAKK